MLLFLDSFDHYSDAQKLEKWTQLTVGNVFGDTTIQAVGRRSSNGIRMRTTNASNNSKADFLHLVPAMPLPADAAVVLGFAFRSVTAFSGMGSNGTSPTAAGTSALFTALYQSTEQFWARLNINGTISVLRGTTVLGTTGTALQENVYSYLEFKVLISDSVGTVNVAINGISEISLTGQNTRNGSVSAWDELRMGTVSNGAAGTIAQEWNFDDLYLTDSSGSGWTGFKGDTRMDVLLPSANGAVRDWTPSTGTDDFAVVDENPPNGDTDYLSASVVGDEVSLVFPDAPVVGADIHGIQLSAYGRKTDSGASGHKALARIGSTNFLGTERGLGSAYAFKREPWDLSPATSAAWTESEFNAAQFGAEKSS